MTNNIADISVFETIQNQANSAMGLSNLSVFNATFNGGTNLNAETQKIVEKLKQKVLDAEKKYRTADNNELKKQKQYERQATEILKKRIAAADKFTIDREAFESSLKPYGITIMWDEPQTDKTTIDVLV